MKTGWLASGIVNSSTDEMIYFSTILVFPLTAFPVLPLYCFFVPFLYSCWYCVDRTIYHYPSIGIELEMQRSNK
jgi:hypothetical protein